MADQFQTPCSNWYPSLSCHCASSVVQHIWIPISDKHWQPVQHRRGRCNSPQLPTPLAWSYLACNSTVLSMCLVLLMALIHLGYSQLAQLSFSHQNVSLCYLSRRCWTGISAARCACCWRAMLSRCSCYRAAASRPESCFRRLLQLLPMQPVVSRCTGRWASQHTATYLCHLLHLQRLLALKTCAALQQQLHCRTCFA
jgi:hypothetical protein